MIYLIILILILQIIQIVLFVQFVNFYLRTQVEIEENNLILPPSSNNKNWEDAFLKEQEIQRKNAELQKQDSIII